MVRNAQSFSISFQEELRALKQYREALMDGGRRDAVESIIQVTSSEMGALKRSRILTVLDGILLARAL